MKRTASLLMIGCLMVFGGVACDDAPDDRSQVDEDDRRLGPGDGVDETGPGR